MNIVIHAYRSSSCVRQLQSRFVDLYIFHLNVDVCIMYCVCSHNVH